VEQNVPAGGEAHLALVARGYPGADFFFVRSGHAITRVYVASLASPNSGAVRIFLRHRFIRLHPVHLAARTGSMHASRTGKGAIIKGAIIAAPGRTAGSDGRGGPGLRIPPPGTLNERLAGEIERLAQGVASW